MAINFNRVPSYIRKELNPPKRTLTNGSRGNKVKQVQEWLQLHSCRTAIDGIYGPATASCVKDFQALKKLARSGKVDRKTWTALVAPMAKALEASRIGRGDVLAETIGKVAAQHVDQHPQEVGGANRGPWVRLYCEGNDGFHWAWCAGFVSLIIQQAAFYRDEKPIIKGSVSCDTLAAQAKDADLFVSEASVKSGRVNWSDFQGSCLFLRRRTTTDWTHTGVAVNSEGAKKNLVFHTIEGNTNDEGDREGYEACRRKHSFSGTHYDFIAFEAIT